MPNKARKIIDSFQRTLLTDVSMESDSSVRMGKRIAVESKYFEEIISENHSRTGLTPGATAQS